MTNQKIRGLLLAALMVTSVFAGTIAFAGAASAANVEDGDADVRYTDQTAFYAGQVVAFGGYDPGETVDVYATNDDGERTVIATQVSADSDGDAVIDTGDLEAGDEYQIEAPSSGYNTFSVVEQDFGVEFDDSTVTNGDTDDAQTELDVSSSNRAGDFNVTVSGNSLDSDELEDIFQNYEINDVNEDDDEISVTLNKGVTNDVVFTDINDGDYELNFTVEDTDATASDSITVTDSGDEASSFADSSVAIEKGDTGTMTVELQNADSAYVQIGVADDDGYQAVAEVVDGNDDGVVNVSLDTYSPDGDDYGVSLPEDDSDTDDEVNVVEVVDGENVSSYSGESALDTGSYDFFTAVSQSDLEFADNNPDDIGTLSIVERNTGSAQSWTAASNADDVDNNMDDEDVLEAVEDGVITQDSEIASSDWAVVQFTETSGLSGAIEADSDDVSMTLTEANPGQNQEAAEVDLLDENNSLNAQVITSDETNNVFVVFQTSEDLEGEWNASLTVEGEELTGDEDGEETASTEFEVVERDGSLDTNDDDVVEVAANENASVTGETNIAPGSEVQVTIQSESGADNPFVNRQTVNVSNDGTFEANFDTADLEVGTNFTASLSAQPGLSGDAEDYEYDAVIVEGGPSEGTETTTDNGTADTTTETDGTPGTETTTSEGTPSEGTDTTPDGTETTTESTSPGFGIAVALVALAGAALLAVRRDN